MWHLRLPLRNASELDKTAPFYVLHEITGNRMVPVELPEISSGLRSVPVRASALRHSATGGPPFLRPACADRIPTACGF